MPGASASASASADPTQVPLARLRSMTPRILDLLLMVYAATHRQQPRSGAALRATFQPLMSAQGLADAHDVNRRVLHFARQFEERLLGDFPQVLQNFETLVRAHGGTYVDPGLFYVQLFTRACGWAYVHSESVARYHLQPLSDAIDRMWVDFALASIEPPPLPHPEPNWKPKPEPEPKPKPKPEPKPRQLPSSPQHESRLKQSFYHVNQEPKSFQ
jgi:hypothetical protein